MYISYTFIPCHSSEQILPYNLIIISKYIIFLFSLIGEIQQRGVVFPFTPDIYRPILNRLKAEGIEFFETSKWV